MDWKKTNFLVYSLSFIFYGCIITGVGPIIPFLAVETGTSQTHYSFLFLTRAIGYIVGGLASKWLVENYKLHHLLAASTSIIGVSFIISSFSFSTLNLTITMFVGSASCMILNVVSNICTMKVFRGEEGFWIQLLHTVFAIGGLIGPILVAIFEVNSFFYFGLFMALISILFFFITAPEQGQEGRNTEIARPISTKVEVTMCILFILYIGQEVGFANWISSYAVMQGVGTLKQASYASSIFWITNTVFKIILLSVKSKVSVILKTLMTGMICVSVINYAAAIGGHEWFAAFIGPFLNGAFLSSMYALFLDLSNEFGYRLSKQNTANFMMCEALGEGILGMPIGYFIGVFGPSALFFCQLSLAITSFILFKYVMSIFHSEEQKTYLTSQQKQIQRAENYSIH